MGLRMATLKPIVIIALAIEFAIAGGMVRQALLPTPQYVPAETPQMPADGSAPRLPALIEIGSR